MVIPMIQGPRRGIVYVAFSGVTEKGTFPPRYGATAFSDDGVLLAGSTALEPANLPPLMGIGTGRYHDIYYSYYPGGFEIVWVEHPESHVGFQRAQTLYLLKNPAASFSENKLEPFANEKPVEVEDAADFRRQFDRDKAQGKPSGIILPGGSSRHWGRSG